MTKQAKLIRELPRTPRGASQNLWHVRPSLAGYSFIVTSSIICHYIDGVPETLIFGSDDTGKIHDYADLKGSFRGGTDHEEAIKRAGYEIVEELT